MAKYKGKNNGQARGQYKSIDLRQITSGENASHKQFLNMAHFFHTYGRTAVPISGYRDYGCHTIIDSSYHIGGATVAIRAVNYEEEPESTDCPQHSIDLKIISNDSISDVVDYITNRFPHLSEIQDE